MLSQCTLGGGETQQAGEGEKVLGSYLGAAQETWVDPVPRKTLEQMCKSREMCESQGHPSCCSGLWCLGGADALPRASPPLVLCTSR